MNNIEILEELINGAKEFNQYNGNKYYKAIENLINRNKELEENLKIATAMLTKGTYPEQNKGDNDFYKQFIPKSKVKEKIEVIQKRMKEETRTDFLIILKILENELQELLEEGE